MRCATVGCMRLNWNPWASRIATANLVRRLITQRQHCRATVPVTPVAGFILALFLLGPDTTLGRHTPVYKHTYT